jgi:hypothetical protein
MHSNLRDCVVKLVREVAQSPELGERKKGDLANLYVRKTHCNGVLILLGYTVVDELRLVYLEAVGPHENFYDRLKRG